MRLLHAFLPAPLSLQLRVWARRFFATLAQRSSGTRSGSNPIYNLLPDIMSALVREPSLDQAGFEAIMKVGGWVGCAPVGHMMGANSCGWWIVFLALGMVWAAAEAVRLACRLCC